MEDQEKRAKAYEIADCIEDHFKLRGWVRGVLRRDPVAFEAAKTLLNQLDEAGG